MYEILSQAQEAHPKTAREVLERCEYSFKLTAFPSAPQFFALTQYDHIAAILY